MYGCEILFTEEQGRKMMDMIERVTGEACPCKQGKTCPLLPDTNRRHREPVRLLLQSQPPGH